MVPRPDVVAFPAEMPVGELISLSAEGRYSRYPVHETDSPDRIIGAVHVKDVLRTVASDTTDSAKTASDLMRDVLTIPENRHIDDILEDLRRQDLQMAVVIDEWGSFEGVFTLEDIVEEIVGEIRDEFDEEEPAVKEMGDGSYLTDGRISINEVNEALGTDFESQDFETVGGLVLGHLGRVPEKGDEVHIDGHLLRVDQTDGPRIAQVLIRRSNGEPAENDPGEE
jgi:CBS domain containing-hemolysin-like protein